MTYIERYHEPWADGLHEVKCVRATYSFVSNGGAAAAHGLGQYLPDNAIIVDSLIDVVTTCTSANDTGTMAISVEGANDIVSAIAINNGGNPWDSGLHAGVPVGTAATAIKLTAKREITATIAVQPFTAGKFHVFIWYVMGD